MKNALILGVTGQDGSYLADFLLKKDYQVFGSYRRTSHRQLERLEAMNTFGKVKLIYADFVRHTTFDISVLAKKWKKSGVLDDLLEMEQYRG